MAEFPTFDEKSIVTDGWVEQRPHDNHKQKTQKDRKVQGQLPFGNMSLVTHFLQLPLTS